MSRCGFFAVVVSTIAAGGCSVGNIADRHGTGGDHLGNGGDPGTTAGDSDATTPDDGDTFVPIPSGPTIDSIVDYHPRLVVRGEAEWEADREGGFAWRVLHGGLRDPDSPANSNQMWDYRSVHSNVDGNLGEGGSILARMNWAIVAAKAMEHGWDQEIPVSGSPWSSSDYDPQYTRDEYYDEAMRRLLAVLGPDEDPIDRYNAWPAVLECSMAYDWLYNANYDDGTPVLSEEHRSHVQRQLLAAADFIKGHADPGSDTLFSPEKIAYYAYVMVGFALYEPSRVGDPTYAAVNAKAAEYLQDFDTYWLGKIIPALEAQGGDGGWHGGLGISGKTFDDFSPKGDALHWHLARYLLAFNTATGKDTAALPYGSGAVRYDAEFQNHMLRPEQQENLHLPAGTAYFGLGSTSPDGSNRIAFVQPMFTYARRRSSTDAEELRLAELGGWTRHYRSPRVYFLGGGSWDAFIQLAFEDKWPDPRSPVELGFSPVRHFEKLGWVSMRTGFDSADDTAAVFVSQKYHWSDLNHYHQNGFILTRKGMLLENVELNTVFIDGSGQRPIDVFPTIAEGPEAYTPESEWYVGPGITAFADTAEYAYVAGDATNAYDTDLLVKFTRQVCFVKPDIFVVFDQVVTAAPGIQQSWVVDPATAPSTAGDGLYTVTNASGGMLWIKDLSPQELTVASQTAERFEVVPAQEAAQVFFVHVLQATDAGLAATSETVVADDATMAADDQQFTVTVKGHEVAFAKDGGFTFDGVSVP